MNSPDDEGVVAGTAKAYDDHAAAYARATSSYDRFPGLDDEIRSYMVRCPEGPAVDLGAGAGRDVNLMSRSGRVVVGVDLSGPMLNEARTLGLATGAHLVRADIRRLPFRTCTFAFTLVSGTLLHLPEHQIPQAVLEAARITFPGGLLAVSHKDDLVRGWKTTELVPSGRWFSPIAMSRMEQIAEAAHLHVVQRLASQRQPWYTVLLQVQ